MISASSSGLTGSPDLRWLMSWFWQNTHPREQPEKKIVPLPRHPLKQDSSP
jgi:hypothetical protein